MNLEEKELLTLGEVIDALRMGKVAISLHPKDKGAVLKYDEERWLIVKYPGEDFFSKEIYIRLYGLDEVKLKRWIIVKEEELNLVEAKLNEI